MTTTTKIALVTGGNRGLGFETCRQLAKKGMKVLLAARDAKKGADAAKLLQKEGLDVTFFKLDTSSLEDTRNSGIEIEHKFGGLDTLVNNAGVYGDQKSGAGAETAFKTTYEVIEHTFRTNTMGPFLLCQSLIPLMTKRGYGRIVNVSSGLGQLHEMGGGNASYRISKTALNAVTCIFAAETKDSGILVNSVCPGWVRTDMGGQGAPRSIEQGTETIVWAATLPDGGPSGCFLRDKEPIPW